MNAFCPKHEGSFNGDGPVAYIEPPIEYQINELVAHLSGVHDGFCVDCATEWEIRQRGEEDIAIEEHVMGYDGSRGCLVCEHEREAAYDEAEYRKTEATTYR